MATAYGLEPVRDAPSVHTMRDAGVGSLTAMEDSTARSYSRNAPPPNPTFSFPVRTDDTSPTTSTTSAASPFPRRTGRRPMSAIEPTTESYQLTADVSDGNSAGRMALPAFSFNPGASLPPDPKGLLAEFLPSSPQLPRTLPPGPRVNHGHRRGGSEFVGGRLREGNSIAVMSGTPTKQELALGAPSLMPPRRGHRRGVSSTLSTNDLSLLAPPEHDFSLKGSSAPNSPTDFDHFHTMSLVVPEPPKPEPEIPPEEKHEEATVVETPRTEPLDQPATPETRPMSKARVGFSDTLEFIPRPLSLVSTDTSSTVTAKPSHNVSGSISSLVSTPSPDYRETSSPVLSRSPSRNTTDSRPSTAGAILDRIPQTEGVPLASPRRRNSIPALLDLADSNTITPSTPSPSKTSKRWSFFGLDSFSHHSASPTKTRPHSSSSGDSATRVVSGCSSSDHESESQAEANESKKTKTKSEKKDKRKRRKKVKGWAGAILPRKPKSGNDKRSKYAVRPPTPPSSIVPPDEEDEEDDMNPPPSRPTLTIQECPPSPPLVSKPPRKSEDVSSPMIDLDAALGPFNTPLPHNPEWEAAQQAAGNIGKRRLHSAQGMRGFSGPGMHYHRRAESAPDLPPFDAARAGIHRFGSSSTMADVFEEEEEEDTTGDDQQSQSGTSVDLSEDSSGEMTPPAVAQSDPVQDVVVNIRRKSSGLSDKEHSSVESIRARRSRTSLHDSPIVEEPPMVRFSTNTFQKEPSNSPRLSTRSTVSPRELGPFEFGPPQAPYAGGAAVSPHSTSFPPTVPRSPVSVDTQRLSTAPSSVHEENSFQSLLLGEPGPEVRLSVEYDIPSLTSSTSTMTRESCFVPQPRMSQPTLRQPRPLSVSSTFGRRRSSLASLSRLISSSHGERSKLSVEVTLDNEAEHKKSKGGKAKRLGKFMQFWKASKDSTTSPNK